MKTYKYTDNTNQVVHIIDEDGISRSSCLALSLPEGSTILPTDTPTQDELKARIKSIRANALEKFPKNSGIATVYELNFEAATLGALDTTTILRNGKTPAQHLGDFGIKLGMTAAQFEAYVKNENLIAGQKMSEIEAQYLTVYYGGTLTEQSIIDYQFYCDVRTSGY